MTQNYVRAVYSASATDSQLNLDDYYQSIELNGEFENVGNVPVKLLVQSFQILINGKVVSDTANDTVKAVENIVFPKQKLPYYLGRIRINEGKTTFKIEDMVNQNVTYKF